MAEIHKHRHLFTSESVTEGHPDKVADHVSDAVLDAVLAQDPKARVACEVLVTTGICVVSGEITTTAHIDVPSIARKTIAANTKIPPAVIEKMGLGNWQTDVPPEQMQFWVDAAKKEGIVNTAADFKSLIWQPK